MAVAPLFYSNMDDLKETLRLSDTNDGAAAILSRVVLDVRVQFYKHLGETRVSQILSTPLSDAPTTAAQVERVKAAGIERIWVKALLLRELPTLFMDSSGDTQQIWNQEGITRQAGRRDISDLVDALMARVYEGLEDLSAGDVEAGEAHVTLIEPENTPIRPGETVFQSTNYGSHQNTIRRYL